MLLEQRVGAAELDERGRDRAMLGVAGVGEKMVTNSFGKAESQVEAADVRNGGRAPDADRRLGSEQESVPPWSAHRGRPQQRGCRGADDHLPGVRDRLHRNGLGGISPRDHKLTVSIPGEEEVELPGVDADRHPESDEPCGGAQASHRAERPLHARGCARSTRRVFLTVEEQEHRVTAPLDEPRSVVVRDGEELREAGVQRVADLLGSDLASSGEALGHRRESRDVDEGERPVDCPPAPFTVVEEPLDEQARDVRPQQLGRSRLLDDFHDPSVKR